MQCPKCGSERITSISDDKQFCLDCDWDNLPELKTVPSLTKGLTINEMLITRVSEECNLNRDEANVAISHAVDELDVGNNSSEDKVIVNRLIEYINNNDVPTPEAQTRVTNIHDILVEVPGGRYWLDSLHVDDIEILPDHWVDRITVPGVTNVHEANHGYFYYSERQKEIINHSCNAFTNYALIDGEIVEYTEWKEERRESNFDDAVYLGEGEFHHTRRRTISISSESEQL